MNLLNRKDLWFNLYCVIFDHWSIENTLVLGKMNSLVDKKDSKIATLKAQLILATKKPGTPSATL